MQDELRGNEHDCCLMPRTSHADISRSQWLPQTQGISRAMLRETFSLTAG